MKYMGSKRRIAKYILPIILKDRRENQWYVEPFCGGCNIIDRVDGNRIANDINEYVIDFFKVLSDGWMPPELVSEEEYIKIKNNPANYPKYLVGFVGVCLSFCSKWFGGYARNKRNVNFAMEGRRGLLKQAGRLKGVIFKSLFYNKIYSPENSIIYCDPPYKGTATYKDRKFDHDAFWQWCRNQSLIGHQIFISEYEAPSDFECVCSMDLPTNMDARYMKKPTEKLFTYNPSRAAISGR